MELYQFLIQEPARQLRRRQVVTEELLIDDDHQVVVVPIKRANTAYYKY